MKIGSLNASDDKSAVKSKQTSSLVASPDTDTAQESSTTSAVVHKLEEVIPDDASLEVHTVSCRGHS